MSQSDFVSESECRFLVQRVLGRLDHGQDESYSQNILAFKGAPGNILGVARRTFKRLESNTCRILTLERYSRSGFRRTVFWHSDKHLG